MKKRADFNFVWLFAIIAGTAILVLMIYAAVRFGKTTTTYQDTDLAKQVVSYLDPFQAGPTAASKGTINSKREIVFESSCDSTNFGYQTLVAKQIRDLNEDFNIFGTEIKIKNKYVYFSKRPSKDFYVFSVPISFAFRVADALIVGSEEFCFLEGYEKIPNFKSIISTIGKKAIFDENNCTGDSIRVCFDYGTNCDIQVIGDCNDDWCDYEFEAGRVIKEGESLEYAGNFLYPALFADKETYDCNLMRLFYKNGVLSLIYAQKSDKMSSRNCPNNLAEDLSLFSQLSFNQNTNLKELYSKGKFLKESERYSSCYLWS